MELLPEKEFRESLKERAGDPELVPLASEPTGLSPKALFDLTLVLDQEVTLAVDGDAEQGYRLIADLNADGRLSDEPIWPMKKGVFDLPLPSGAKEAKDASIAEIDTRLKRIHAGKEVEIPFLMKVVLTEDAIRPPGGEASRRYALSTLSTLRTGVLSIPGRSVPFAIRGEGGIYDYDHDCVVFDLDGDGKLDATKRTSMEFFWVWEKTVNLGGRSYAFSVDRFGRSLTLTPAKKSPERADLEPGHPAPDFTFRDLAGKKHRLGDYRGKVVLLDFWGTWCPACVVHAGDLARAYEELQPQGFEIIGIEAGGTAKEVEEFISRYNLTWPQTIDPVESSQDGPLRRLYRVLGAPDYFLIGPKGEILLSGEIRPAVVIREARARLSARP